MAFKTSPLEIQTVLAKNTKIVKHIEEMQEEFEKWHYILELMQNSWKESSK